MSEVASQHGFNVIDAGTLQASEAPSHHGGFSLAIIAVALLRSTEARPKSDTTLPNFSEANYVVQFSASPSELCRKSSFIRISRRG